MGYHTTTLDAQRVQIPNAEGAWLQTPYLLMEFGTRNHEYIMKLRGSFGILMFQFQGVVLEDAMYIPGLAVKSRKAVCDTCHPEGGLKCST